MGQFFLDIIGWEPWSSGYGWQLMFKRSWVQIPVPNTGWTFFTLVCCKNCNVCLKRPKINEKEAGDGQLKNFVYFTFFKKVNSEEDFRRAIVLSLYFSFFWQPLTRNCQISWPGENPSGGENNKLWNWKIPIQQFL